MESVREMSSQYPMSSLSSGVIPSSGRDSSLWSFLLIESWSNLDRVEALHRLDILLYLVWAHNIEIVTTCIGFVIQDVLFDRVLRRTISDVVIPFNFSLIYLVYSCVWVFIFENVSERYLIIIVHAVSHPVLLLDLLCLVLLNLNLLGRLIG